ncbi:hypothetical protein AgCh_036676 [Apium graveolens]
MPERNVITWMYANFWITGTLIIVRGSLISLNHLFMLPILLRFEWDGLVLLFSLLRCLCRVLQIAADCYYCDFPSFAQ